LKKKVKPYLKNLAGGGSYEVIAFGAWTLSISKSKEITRMEGTRRRREGKGAGRKPEWLSGLTTPIDPRKYEKTTKQRRETGTPNAKNLQEVGNWRRGGRRGVALAVVGRKGKSRVEALLPMMTEETLSSWISPSEGNGVKEPHAGGKCEKIRIMMNWETYLLR